MEKKFNNERLKTLAFDRFGLPTAIVDQEGKVLDCNHAWRSLVAPDDCKTGGLALVQPNLPVTSLLAKAERDGQVQIMLPAALERRPSHPLRLEISRLEPGVFLAVTSEPDDPTAVERLKALFDSLQDAVYIHDLKGNFLEANETALKMLGYSRDEIRRLSFADLLPPEEVPLAIDRLTELLETGRQKRYSEFNLRRKDGAALAIETMGALIRVRGEPDSILGIARDITARKRMIESQQKLSSLLQAEHRKLRTTLDNMMETVLLVDEHDIIRDANRMSEDTLKLRREEMIGHRFEEFHPPQVGVYIQKLLEPLKSGEQDFIAFERKVAGRWLAFRFGALRGPDRSYAGFILNLMDVTPIVTARERAEEQNRLKSRFLHHMSHEIRTPMNGILGFAELLAGSGLAPQQDHYVQSIVRSGNHLLHLINQILDLARIEAGRAKLEPRAFNPRMLAREALEMVRPEAQKKGLDLKTRVSPTLPGKLFGDDRKCLQVLINLLGNAVKFTDRGKVELSLSLDGDFLRARVSDTGPGIAATDAERVFASFEQLETSDRRREGTGLGLAISKRLAELMGGDVALESKPGAGSTFVFSARVSTVLEAEETAETPAAPRPQVLAVASDPDQRAELKALVEAAGFEAVAVPPAEAELRLRLHEPAAALFAVDPASSRVARKLHSENPETPLVAVIANRAEQPDWAQRELRWPATSTEVLAALLPPPESRNSMAPGPLVLVAEDHPLNLEMTLEMLRLQGFRADGAEDGRRCLARAREIKPDLILMDLAMPDMDGFEALRNFRADPDLKTAPIIALTAYAMPEDRDRVIQAGFDGYVAKPFTTEELISAIEHELERQRRTS